MQLPPLGSAQQPTAPTNDAFDINAIRQERPQNEMIAVYENALALYLRMGNSSKPFYVGTRALLDALLSDETAKANSDARIEILRRSTLTSTYTSVESETSNIDQKKFSAVKGG